MRSLAVVGLLIGFALAGCARVQPPVNEIVVEPAATTSASPYPTETPVQENLSLANKKPQYLCDHLAELKKMPWEVGEISGDAVYDAIRRKHYDTLPCLVDKITDMHLAENPTGAPFMAGLTYRVGDTAVLMLMDYGNMYWPRGMLSKKYEDMFQDEGMFAYYYYVHQVPGSRKRIQIWWRNWLKTCQPECAKLPPLETKK